MLKHPLFAVFVSSISFLLLVEEMAKSLMMVLSLVVLFCAFLASTTNAALASGAIAENSKFGFYL